MKEMKQDRLALDRASARSFDELSGHLHVAQTNISKATVNPYRGSEIPFWEKLGLEPDKIYQLLRHPEELAKGASSFHNKPLVMAHRAQSVTDTDHLNRVGVASNPVYEHPFLKADLAAWTDEAINAIESEDQRELSCGYGYEPDMTPGTYEGQRYDGIMRNINGNHVALVKEGRAGADCHVFDSMEGLHMNTKKAALSRTGDTARGALTVFLKPKLAQDAKIDLVPVLKGLTAKNYKASKAKLAVDIKTVVKGKLAKDADLEDVIEFLDTLEEAMPDDPTATMPDIAPPAEEMSQDDDGDEANMRSLLSEMGILDEDIEKFCAKMKGGAAEGADSAPSDKGSSGSEESSALTAGMGLSDPNAGGGSMRSYAPVDQGDLSGDEKEKPDDDDEKKKANPFAKDKTMKPAMDAAFVASQIKLAEARGDQKVKLAEDRMMQRHKDIRDAERDVRPWVGDLAMAADSAEGVYRTALEMLGNPRSATAHKDALADILNTHPKPGDRPRREATASLALDAKNAVNFDDRFGTARITHAA